MIRPIKSVPNNFLKPGKSLNLSQAYGAVSMPEFAVLAPNGTMIGVWMRCKDYIQDIWWGFYNNKSYSIYGWSWNPESDPHPSTRWLLLAIRWVGKTDEQMTEMLNNVRHTIADVEKRLRIPKHLKTRFSSVRDGYFVIFGSPRWLRAVCTVSFFAWLIRASLTNDGHKFDTLDKKKFPVQNDAYYANSGANTIRLIMSGLRNVPTDWEKYTTVGQVHNNGIQTQNHSSIESLKKLGLETVANPWA